MKSAPIDLGIKTDNRIELHSPAPAKPAKKPRQEPAQPQQPIDPLDHLYAARPVEKTSLLKKVRAFLFGRALSFVFWTILLPGIVNFKWICGVISAFSAFVASLGGYHLNKAPDTEEGRVVARAVSEPKATIATRVMDKVSKPVEVVKEAGKNAVAKAEKKADEIKVEAAEIKQEVITKADGLKDTIQGLKVETPEEPARERPGILSTVKGKLSDAKDAVSDKLGGAFKGEQLTPQQLEKQRDAIHRKQVLANRRIKRAGVQNTLGVMGQQQMNAAAGLAAQSEAQFRQQADAAIQQHNNMTQQLNNQLRGRR